MSEEKEEVVKKVKTIARRVPPGDRWALLDSPDEVESSLTAILQKYVTLHEYRGEFVLRPLFNGGEVCAVEEVTVEKKHKTWDLYGEH